MSSINWKYFVVAAEELNFTRAAQKLFISQQSLSNYIVKLEAALGLELFNRRNGLSLTEAGESLYKNAKKILVMEELAQKEISDIRDFRTSSLRIGVSRSRGSRILPMVLPELKNMYPELRVEVVEKRLKELHRDLLEGEIDVVFAYAEEKHPDLVYEVYAKEELKLVISDTLLKSCFEPEVYEALLNMEHVPLEMFARCPFIMLKEGGWLNKKIQGYFDQKGVTLENVFYTSCIDTMVNLGLVGYGVTVCPHIYLKEPFVNKIAKEPLHFFDLDEPGFSPDRAVIYMKKRYLPKVARDFIEIVKKYQC